MWMREEAFNSAAKLHKPDRLEHVAERVACILFSNNAGELVQTFLNQDFEPYAMMLDLLGKGEEEFKYRASALREAQRRIVVCAAYADGLDGKRKRAPKLADGHR
jgi:hypothetical protein